MYRIGTMMLLAALGACTLNDPPTDKEDALEWFAERIEARMVDRNCPREIAAAAQYFRIGGSYARERRPDEAEKLLTSARRCVEYLGDWFETYARLVRSLGDNVRAESAARKAVEHLLASTPADLMMPLCADEIAEEFSLTDLHRRVIVHQQKYVRQLAHTYRDDPCTLHDSGGFTARHPLPECTQ